jgi:hypothetical protein
MSQPCCAQDRAIFPLTLPRLSSNFTQVKMEMTVRQERPKQKGESRKLKSEGINVRHFVSLRGLIQIRQWDKMAHLDPKFSPFAPPFRLSQSRSK